jgi:ATP-binding cassette, subfamily B (MDR/TAP), member 1
LIRKPAVLILDEATSALDVKSANLIRDTVERLVKDPYRAMTVIIITHNRKMMEAAENIVVLDKGTVVERGGSEELMATDSALKNLLSGGEWVEAKAQRVNIR